MTVSSTVNKTQANGNGSTSAFPFAFKFTASSEIEVYVDDTLKTLSTHYTLSSPGDSGTVTFLTSPTDFRPQSGEVVTIRRIQPLTQTFDPTAGGGLSSSSVEGSDDNLLMKIQQIDEQSDRAPRLKPTTETGQLTFPEPVASAVIAYNAAGTDLETKGLADIDGITTPASSVDEAIVRFDGTSGLSFQNSGVTIDDSNNVAGVATLGAVTGTFSGNISAVNLTQAGYADLAEISEPSTPSANISRAYARDVNGVTHRFAKDSTGRNRILTPTICDVLEFGALGDGSTDDTAEIAAAITAAGTGGTLYFPEGVYIFSDHDTDGTGLTQLSGQKWFGAGRGGTILRLAAATTDIDVLIDASDFAEDYSIENMQIDGNRANVTPSTDLFNTFFMIRGPRGGKRGVYRNLHLANSWGRSLQTSDETQSELAEDILVENVWVTNAGTKAISATRSQRVTIKGCYVEVDPYANADHGGSDDADSGSCFECNESTDITIMGNHGIQIGASITAPGIRFVNECERIRCFGNTIEGAEYLGFIQNANDVEFFSNIGRDITGDAIIIADADGESGTCRRVRVHDNTIIDPDGAYVVITANRTAGPEVECYIYNNTFHQASGSPTHGIYNNGVTAPAAAGTCLVYQWGNRFTGTIPNQLAGPAAAEIRNNPDQHWQILGQSSVAVSHTGDTNETTLATISVPANRMGANGRLRVTAHWSYTNSGNNKITRVRFGGSQATATTNTTTAQQKLMVDIGNRNSLSSQIVGIPGSSDALGTTTTAVTTLSIDTTSDRNVTITGALANTGETITLENYTVEIFHAV